MKIVISVLGRDRVGIIAMVSTVLAENGGFGFRICEF